MTRPDRFRYRLRMILTRMVTITTMASGSHACLTMLSSELRRFGANPRPAFSLLTPHR